MANIQDDNLNENVREPRSEQRQRTHSNQSGGDTDSGTFKFNTVGTGGRYTSLGGLSDQVVQTFKKHLQDAGSDDNTLLRPEWHRQNFKLIDIPPSRNTTNAPTLVVALPAVFGAKKVTIAYVMMFDINQVQERRPAEDGHRNSYDSLVLVEHSFTQRYQNEIINRLSFLGGEVKIIASQIVPNTLVKKLEANKEDISLVAPVMDNAFQAICSFYEDYEDIVRGVSTRGTLRPESLDRNERLEVSYAHNADLGYDSVGTPIQSDIVATVSVSLPIEEERGEYNRIPVLEARAGLDLYVRHGWGDRDVRQGFANRSRREIQPFIQAVLNINSIIGKTPDMPYTLGTVMLGIDAIAQQTNDLRWAYPLAPQNFSDAYGDSQIDLGLLPSLNPDERDLGRVDLPPNMSQDELADFLEAHVIPDVVMGMIVTQTGDRGWLMRYFSNWAHKPNDTALRNRFFKEADELTGGAFSDIVASRPGGERGFNFIEPIGAQALMGTYVGKDGKLRPLSEINVAVLRTHLGDRSHAVDVCMDYQRTFEDNTRSIDRNLADRYDILQKNFQGVNVYGLADMLVFDADGVETLSQAIAEADMSPYLVSNDTSMSRNKPQGAGYGGYARSNLGHGRSREQQRGGGRRNGRFDLLN